MVASGSQELAESGGNRVPAACDFALVKRSMARDRHGRRCARRLGCSTTNQGYTRRLSLRLIHVPVSVSEVTSNSRPLYLPPRMGVSAMTFAQYGIFRLYKASS